MPFHISKTHRNTQVQLNMTNKKQTNNKTLVLNKITKNLKNKLMESSKRWST